MNQIKKLFSRVKFFSLTLFTVVIILISISPAPGQLPLPSLPSTSTPSPSSTTVSAQTVGNIIYAPVKLDGIKLFDVAVSTTYQNNNHSQTPPIEVRVKTIEAQLHRVLEQGDPATLKISTGTLQGQTVILASDEEKLKIRPVVIGTITDLDAQLQGVPVSELAERAPQQLYDVLQRAWFERQPQYLRQQGVHAFKIIGLMSGISLLLILLKKRLKEHWKILRDQRPTQESVVDLSGKSFITDQMDQERERLIELRKKLTHWKSIEAQNSGFLNLLMKIRIFLLKKRLKVDWKRFKKKYLITTADTLTLETIETEPLDQEQQNFLKYQHELITWKRRRKRNLNLRRLLLIGHIFIWFPSIIYILKLFPQTREWGYILEDKPLTLLIIWISIIFLDKLGDFLIDRSFQEWADDQRLSEQTNQRLWLKIPTYTNVLQKTTSTFFIFLAIFLSLLEFNVPLTTLLTGLGLLGFAASFAAQEFIKDIIRGITILWVDPYSVGDVVNFGEVSGFVENLNLLFTQLRNADGELITIHNGSIGIIRNLTKEWSRVNCTVEVHYDTDVDRALSLIQQIALELYEDPNWSDRMIDSPPEVLGVDSLTHNGMLIRTWIKTQPSKQWEVGREFRRRLKQRLTQEGIAIGLPQQRIYFQRDQNRICDSDPASVEITSHQDGHQHN